MHLLVRHSWLETCSSWALTSDFERDCLLCGRIGVELLETWVNTTDDKSVRGNLRSLRNCYLNRARATRSFRDLEEGDDQRI